MTTGGAGRWCRIGANVLGLILTCLLSGGCNETKLPATNAPVPSPPPPPPPAGSALPGMNVPGLAPLTQPGSATPAGQAPGVAPAPGNPAPQSEVERVKAEAGVAAAGRSLDNETGIIVEPAKALFAVRERAVFEIQIPSALNLFNATEGRMPQSHDEFMTKIVQANSIQLPRLPEGQRYVYDPQRGELMVERPGKK